MSFLLESLQAAFRLIIEANPELLTIVWFSLKISIISTFCAALPGILGGNIKGLTRTMTTMALEYDKCEFSLAVTLGIILMAITL